MNQNEYFAFISNYILRNCPDKLKAIRDWLNTYNLDDNPTIDKELEIAAKEYGLKTKHNNLSRFGCMIAGFRVGAKWREEHPKQ